MMNGLSLGAVLRAVLVAGLAAGVVAAAFHFVATEPLIDRAIALEEQLSAQHEPHEEPLVSRDTQRVGLVVGFLLYGLTWSLFLGLAYHLAQSRLPASGAMQRGLLLAVAACWSVALFPLLKYPANPPGVGDPETITYRQSLYLGFLGLSIVGTVLAFALPHVARRFAGRGVGTWLPSLAFLGVFDAILYLAMPENPDPVRMPAEVMASFRALSLGGLMLFWAVLGGVFGLLLRRLEKQRTSGSRRVAAAWAPQQAPGGGN